MKKDCSICEKSVEVKYIRYNRRVALFCIAAPPCMESSSINLSNVTNGKGKLWEYRRYPEVSSFAPCFLYKETKSKKKIEKYEKELKEIKEAKEKKLGEEKRKKAIEKRERLAAKRRIEKAKIERARKKEKAIAQKKYRAKKKAEKEAEKAERNKYNRFEIMDFKE
jgi:hypothetical protein